jgi:hypothetical protein
MFEIAGGILIAMLALFAIGIVCAIINGDLGR